MSLSITNTTEQEIGTIKNMSYTSTLNPGSYSYDSSTGVSVSSWLVTLPDGLSTDSPSGTLDSVQFTGSTQIVTAKAAHTQGIIPHTNIGTECPDLQIQAGEVSKSVSIPAGYRKLFYGYSDKTNILQIGSTDIRSLANSKKNASGALTTLSEDTSAKSIIIACPRGTRILRSVVMPSSSSADVTSQFVKQQALIMVKGANDYEATPYDIWLYVPATMAGTYLITLG